MSEIQKVSSTDFAGRFGQWSFAAQSAPVMVTNRKTGVVLGYFVSASEFEAYARFRESQPRARFAWEMPSELRNALDAPLDERHPELDELIKD